MTTARRNSAAWAPVLLPLATMAVSCILLAQPVVFHANLVSNPGFEDQEAAGAQPLAWTFSKHTGTPKPLVSGEAAHGGKRCVGIETSAPEDTGLWSQTVAPLDGAQIYRLSAWIKTSPGASAMLSASFYSKEKKWLAADYHVVQAKDILQWRRRAGCFRIVPGTASIRIALWGNYGSRTPGTVWFDDIELATAEDMPAIRYISPNDPPNPRDADNARGYVPFVRDYLDLMPPTYTPSRSEIEAELTTFCSIGEFEPLSFGIYALRDLKNVSAITTELKSPTGAIIPASAVDVRSVRYLYKRSHYSGARRATGADVPVGNLPQDRDCRSALRPADRSAVAANSLLGDDSRGGCARGDDAAANRSAPHPPC